eukprot:jgi/Botrbrau1/2476/Bobra.0226s0034.1
MKLNRRMTKISLLLCNNGLVQEPLESLLQRQRISKEPPNVSNEKPWKPTDELLTHQHDSIAGLLVLGSTHGGLRQNGVPQISGGEPTNALSFLPSVWKTETGPGVLIDFPNSPVHVDSQVA